MEYPVCKLWLHLVKKYDTTQPFTKFSKEYSLSYQKVRQYGSNTFKKLDGDFVLKLCEILNCSFDEMIIEDKEDYYRRRSEGTNHYLNHSDVVYFVKNDEGLTKIGRTGDLKTRLLTLKNYPRSNGIKLIHFIETEDPKVLEKTLHKVFADKRISGEWFKLSDQDLTNIKKC